MTSLLLVGKTGSGKSSTGNSILGRNVFEAITSASSVTKSLQHDYVVINGREVKVVDGPGLMDTDCNQHESATMVCREVDKAIMMCPEGFDAILVVTDMTRFTNEDREVIRHLKSTFGQDFVEKHCILIVTHADDYDPEENGKTLEDWCDDQTGSFNEVKKECGNRLVPFFNKTKNENIKKNQILRLFKFVDEIRSKHGRYDQGLFEKARQFRQHLLVEMNVPILREETDKMLSLRMKQLEEMETTNKEQALSQLEQMKREVSSVLEELKGADQGTDALKGIKGFVDAFILQIDAKIDKIQVCSKIEKKIKDQEIQSQLDDENELKEIQQLKREFKELMDRDAQQKEQISKQTEELKQSYSKMQQNQQEQIMKYAFLWIQIIGGLVLIFRKR